jgi:hypothetical protein
LVKSCFISLRSAIAAAWGSDWSPDTSCNSATGGWPSGVKKWLRRLEVMARVAGGGDGVRVEEEKEAA